MAGARKSGKSGSGAGRKPEAAGREAPAKAATAKHDQQEKDDPHPIEWVIGAISTVLVLSVLGYLCFRGLAGDSRPPEFAAKVESVELAGDFFHVTVSIANTGDETAAGVILEAALGAEGEAGRERGEIAFDYLPAGSKRRGSFVFRNDPSRGELRLSVLGYTEP